MVIAETFRWHRTSRANPCKVCEHPDWCTFTLDGKAGGGSCCMRVESVKPMKNGGFWHPFNAPLPPEELRRIVTPQKPVAPAPDFGALMNRWRMTVTPDHWQAMADNLGLEWASLWWMSPVWATEYKAMAFPMFEDASAGEEYPCGIRLRTLDGKKFAVTGSKAGLFIPHRAINATTVNFNLRRLFVCEGPTDTAACLQMGFFAIGRASCRGGEDAVLSVVNRYASEVVIVSDNDGPGAEGADVLAAKIRKPIYRLCTPSKDLRAFIKDGGTAAVVEALINNLIRK